MQYPVEVPGVTVGDLLAAATRARGARPTGLDERLRDEAARLGVRDEFLERGVNDEFSGGEKKRVETLQLAVLRPKFAVLDEIDSGLDVDALRDVARRVEAMTEEYDLGVLAITHYARLLTELRPDRVHVLMGGRVVASGGPELADQLEADGLRGPRRRARRRRARRRGPRPKPTPSPTPASSQKPGRRSPMRASASSLAISSSERPSSRRTSALCSPSVGAGVRIHRSMPDHLNGIVEIRCVPATGWVDSS